MEILKNRLLIYGDDEKIILVIDYDEFIIERLGSDRVLNDIMYHHDENGTLSYKNLNIDLILQLLDKIIELISFQILF